MANQTVLEQPATLEELQSQVAQLLQRLQSLENAKAAPVAAAIAVSAPVVEPVPAETAQAGITEDELLVISAAIGAFLGVRAHIRQIRLLSSNAWAQQGRVSIQASHRLG